MPFVPWVPVAGNTPLPLPVASGGTGAATAAAALTALGTLPLQAATPAAGFALQNATPTILTWTAPNDGQQHRVSAVTGKHVSVAETGGQVTLTTLLPDGTTAAPVAYAGGSAPGGFGFSTDRIVEAGATVTLAQTSALTAGTSVVWAQLWGL